MNHITRRILARLTNDLWVQLSAASYPADVVRAIRWLGAYFDAPSSVNKNAAYVTEMIRPLTKAVPFIPAPGPFYWLAPVGTRLNHQRIAAFTSLRKHDWEDLAESIGLFDEGSTRTNVVNVYEVSNFNQIFNYVWLKEILRELPSSNLMTSFLWERETVAQTSPKTSLRLIWKLRNPYL